jgi:hypothetical protein
MGPTSHPSPVALSACLLMWLHVSAGPAVAKTLYVKTTGNDSASCTAAAPCLTIKHAVAVADPGDTISVGYGTFGESAGISISKNLTIAGGWFLGTRITLGFIDRSQVFVPVFEIAPGVKVKLTGLTVSGGSSGGISNRGNLTLSNVWVWNNAGGGGVSNDAGVTNVGIDHNSGQAGLINHGNAFVVDFHIASSQRLGPSPGDGIYNAGRLIASQGLVAGNQGRGLQQPVADCAATTYLFNVTISGNHDSGVDAACGQLILRHVTIAANKAGSGAGGLQVRDITPVLENSIIATNGGKQCGFTAAKSIDISHSLVGDDSCTSFLFPSSTAGNLVGVDPKLSALAYRAGEELIVKLFHIGANRAHAPLPGSPVIDSGADALCTDPLAFGAGGGGWLTDQFGTQRPIDGNGDGTARCDMGAYEYQPPG